MCHYWIGPVTVVTILAEIGDPRCFSSSREAVRFSGPDITVHASGRRVRRVACPAGDPQRCAGRCSKPRDPRDGQTHPITPTTSRRPRRLGGKRACLSVVGKLLKR